MADAMPATAPDPTAVHDALDAATRAIAGVLDVEAVLQVIVDEVRPLVGARYAALGIADADYVMERFITSGISTEERAAIGAPPHGKGLLAALIREGRSIRIPDIAHDPRSYGFPPNHPPMTTFLGVPVTLGGRSVGNLYLTDKADGRIFTEGDQAIVETFARHAAIAIDNARLHEQVRRLAIVDERERISADLHDGIIQSLYAVGLSLEDVPDLMDEEPDEVVRRVERAIDSLHLTIRDIRNFIFGLRPELLGGTTLIDGLVAVTEEARHHTVVQLEVDLDGLSADPGPAATPHILAIVSEALSNVARHAAAGQAWVEAASTLDGGTVVIVRDDGRGFDPATGATLGHQGLANMRSRAEAIGATLSVDGEPGVGTTVRLVLPPSPGASAA